MSGQRPRDPQLATPALFVPWQEVAKQLDIPVVHEDLSEDLRTMFQTAIGILPTEHQRDFHQLQGIAFSQIPQGRVPVETVAPIVLDSMYDRIGNPCSGTWRNPIGSGLLPLSHPRQIESKLTVVALAEAPWTAQPPRHFTVLTQE